MTTSLWIRPIGASYLLTAIRVSVYHVDISFWFTLFLLLLDFVDLICRLFDGDANEWSVDVGQLMETTRNIAIIIAETDSASIEKIIISLKRYSITGDIGRSMYLIDNSNTSPTAAKFRNEFILFLNGLFASPFALDRRRILCEISSSFAIANLVELKRSLFSQSSLTVILEEVDL